ncbi:hypothetical protein NQ129_04935 [Priestia aryabhattai]|uniref:hypothetical protein n=1 Tax=Priestia aryabhattai TaxID=412384 RepID=UPI00211CB879|nr:hypothetical protein [Priestia aryabhattai]MCQ9281111.1 hypothetical protein [Priestia aryabhattai]
MKTYEVVYVDHENEYKVMEYKADDLRECLDQFNNHFQHKVDIACIQEFNKGYFNKVFKFKISEKNLQYFIEEAKMKSKKTDKNVQIIQMKAGRKREPQSSGSGCLVWVVVLIGGYFLFKYIF